MVYSVKILSAMKKVLLLSGFFALLFLGSLQAQTQYKVVTVVESIIPAGIGRSRIIENNEAVPIAQYTTQRTDGRTSGQGDIDRSDLKISNFYETKLLNFFSMGGINFQNIASNDALISAKLDQLTAEGWELAFVTSGVESQGSDTDQQGIFITRFVFKKVSR
jgi:hypothetical protein